MENLHQKMTEAIKAEIAKVLTISDCQRLKGKRIQTIYFGYRGQNGVDDFLVGEVVEKEWSSGYEKKVKELHTLDGRATCIRNHFMLYGTGDVFTCSDSDREVYYIEA